MMTSALLAALCGCGGPPDQGPPEASQSALKNEANANADDPASRIKIRPAVARPRPAEEERFGLTEQRRREIYQQIVKADEHGQADAVRKHPKDYAKRTAFAAERSKANRAVLAKQVQLSLSQLEEISTEGFMKEWPGPGR
jgi:hypothetical protein